VCLAKEKKQKTLFLNGTAAYQPNQNEHKYIKFSLNLNEQARSIKASLYY
jgi:hypothetical protein